MKEYKKLDNEYKSVWKKLDKFKVSIKLYVLSHQENIQLNTSLILKKLHLFLRNLFNLPKLIDLIYKHIIR
jgi:hypothetical protein